MTEMQQGQAGTEPAYSEPTEVTGWVGWVMFAGVMMFIDGCFSVIAGLVALFNDDYYLVGPNGLVVNADYTAWGWVHVLLGLVVAGAGLGAMAGQTWARVVGVVLATISAIVNFAFLADWKSVV